ELERILRRSDPDPETPNRETITETMLHQEGQGRALFITDGSLQLEACIVRLALFAAFDLALDLSLHVVRRLGEIRPCILEDRVFLRALAGLIAPLQREFAQ